MSQSSDFSFITALKNMQLDPFPTDTFRALISPMHRIALMLEKLHGDRSCCINVIKGILAPPPSEASSIEEEYRYIPSAEVYKLLTQKQVPDIFMTSLTKCLLYIVVKFERCEDYDVISISKDFAMLQECIFLYRKYSTWDNSKVDKTVRLFLKKTIRLLNEFSESNRKDKLRLFNLIRIMVTNFGKHPIYSGVVIKQLCEEIHSYYDNVKESPMRVDAYIHENYLGYLHILSQVVKNNLINKDKNDIKAILSSLKNVLNDIIALNRMTPREAYFVQYIAGITGVYLSA